MKHEPASIARSELARRITERAKGMLNGHAPVIIQTQDELDKAARKIQVGEAPGAIVSTFEILRLAALVPALKRVGNNGAHFVVAPSVAHCGMRRNLISGRIVRQLIEDGLLSWVNESQTAVVLTQRGRGEP